MPYFSVLVGNLRAEPDYAPDADETLVRGDRQHPILGNHGFAMKDKTLFERRRVIEEFARRLDLDTAQSGPLSRLLRDLAQRARRRAASLDVLVRSFALPPGCRRSAREAAG